MNCKTRQMQKKCTFKLWKSWREQEAQRSFRTNHWRSEERKARRSGSNTLDFMREKMEKVMTFKQEEMAQRRSIRAAKNAGTTEQCVATDAPSKGYYQ